MRQFTKNKTLADENAGRGKLNLLLTGFSRQEVVPTNDILRAVDGIPAFHLEGLREIVYLPEAASLFTHSSYRNFGCSRPKAEFLQKERRIYVYEFDGRGMFFHMLHHEIGHFVFFLVIGSRVKKRWVTEIFPGSDCVTPYAALNATEDFAETYAYYLLQPEWLEQLFPLKHAFMRDSVFSGAAHTLKERVRGEPE
jgi:hypothetical protein